MTANVTRSTATSLVRKNEGYWIQDVVRSALSATGYRAVADLNCEVVDDVIVLSGVVSSFYLKQVAQQAVLNLKRFQVLRNVVEVKRITS